MKLTEKYNLSKVLSLYEEAKRERTEWFSEWQTISDYLLPGRGVFTDLSKPSKRKLSSSRIINNTGGEALKVLASGLYSWLTSPSKPWFALEWTEAQINKVKPAQVWLKQCEGLLRTGLQISNFYAVAFNFYKELGGFASSCMYVGEDSAAPAPFRFRTLTVGEYAFMTDANQLPTMMFRPIYMSPAQIVRKFPNPPKEMVAMVEDNAVEAQVINRTVIETVFRHKFMDKQVAQLYYLVGGATDGSDPYAASNSNNFQEPLGLKGFYEFPYLFSRWDMIGSDIYGVGPGSEALPDIKRLQEIEKASLMATHKMLDPPLNVPSRMRGKVKSLPGARNYYANPQEVIQPLYNVNFDKRGAIMDIERIEQRIKQVFYNDLFLTASRDPNATPYKATEVVIRDQEKMLRIGPAIERLQYEFLNPLLSRCFNIMLRKGLFPEMPPEVQELATTIKINIISPLAIAQRAVSLQSINQFIAFTGSIAQYAPEAIDRVDADEAVKEYAYITGVPPKMVRDDKEVNTLRQQRAEAQQQEQNEQKQLMLKEFQVNLENKEAQTRKLNSEAGNVALEGQAKAQETGMI